MAISIIVRHMIEKELEEEKKYRIGLFHAKINYLG
jgi:hypothetical protein